MPYVCDNAWGTPFLGTDPRRIGADVMLYSMDKVAGASTSGLVIGREDADGQHSPRAGHSQRSLWQHSAHGKASHVAADPGKVTMTGMLAALRVLRDQPQSSRSHRHARTHWCSTSTREPRVIWATAS